MNRDLVKKHGCSSWQLIGLYCVLDNSGNVRTPPQEITNPPPQQITIDSVRLFQQGLTGASGCQKCISRTSTGVSLPSVSDISTPGSIISLSLEYCSLCLGLMSPLPSASPPEWFELGGLEARLTESSKAQSNGSSVCGREWSIFVIVSM